MIVLIVRAVRSAHNLSTNTIRQTDFYPHESCTTAEYCGQGFLHEDLSSNPAASDLLKQRCLTNDQTGQWMWRVSFLNLDL